MRIIKITIAVVALALAAGVQVQSQGQGPSPAERAAAEQAALTRMMAMSRPIDAVDLALLTDIANSLKSHGFAHVVLLGDSLDNQPGMKDVASTRSAKWAGSKSRIHFIPEYYDYPGAKIWAEANLGWKQITEGHHDDPVITTIMMTVDPSSVRISQRIAKSKASINGISLIPVDKAIEAGRKLVDFRSDPAVAAIKKAIASSTTSTP